MKKIVSIIVLSVVLLSLFAFAGCQTVKEKVDEAVDAIDNVIAVDENGQELIAGEVYQMPSSLTFNASSLSAPSMASPGGLPALASISILATVLPSSAVNKKVDWAVEWVNPESAFATGKDVKEFVNVIPASDGSNEATVECYQTFASDVIRVIVITRDGGYKANCLVSINYNVFNMKLENNGIYYAWIENDTALLSAGDTYAFDPVFFTKLGFGVADYTPDLVWKSY